MLDASEALGRNSDPGGLRAAFTPPARYTDARNSVLNEVGIEESKDEISEEAIREALSRILESSIFASRADLADFFASRSKRR